jgi:hypothetical protein
VLLTSHCDTLERSTRSSRPKVITQQSTLDLTVVPSTADDIVVGTSRLARVGSQRVLEDILKTRKDWKVDGGKLGRDSVMLSTVSEEDNAKIDKPALRRVTDRSTGFDPSYNGGESSKPSRTTLKRIISSRSLPYSHEGDKPAADLFAAKKFALIEDANAPVVVARLTGCGALVLPSNDDLTEADFIVVRLAR